MNNRMLRADAEIQKELAQIIKNDLSDPRLQTLISVTGVKTSSDFTNVKARVSIYEQEKSHNSIHFEGMCSKCLLFGRSSITQFHLF